MKKLPKGFWWVVIGGLIFYFLLVAYADFGDFIDSLKTFGWVYVPLIIMLVILNYLIRFVKWHFLLGSAGIQIKKTFSFSVFMAGLAGTLSPGKSGEFIKPLLLNQKKGIPISKGVPVFFFERLTDLMALVILSFLGIKSTFWEVGNVILIALGFLLILFFFSNPLFWKLVFGLIGYTPKKGPFKLIMDISENIQIFWKFKVLTITLLLSILGWFMECIGYYLVFKGFGLEVPLTTASFIYAFSTVLGAIVLIPGGLGVTDGSLAALSNTVGVGKATSVASTFIIRGFTLWFAVLIGIIFLIKLQGGKSYEEIPCVDNNSVGVGNSDHNTGESGSGEEG